MSASMRDRLAVAGVLCLILALGAFLRLHGAGYGLPYVFNIDEPLFVRRGLLTARDLDPRWYNAPAATAHMMLGAIYSSMYDMDAAREPLDFDAWSRRELDGVTRLVRAGRLACGIVDCLTIVLVFALARRLGRPRPEALLAALLYAVSAQAVAMAHVIRQDTLLVFFMMAAAIAAAPLASRPSRMAALVAGACAGLATASKWPGGTAILVVPAGLLARWFGRGTPDEERSPGEDAPSRGTPDHPPAPPVDGQPPPRAAARTAPVLATAAVAMPREPSRTRIWSIALVAALAGTALIRMGIGLDATAIEDLGARADKPVTAGGITFARRGLLGAGLLVAGTGLAGPVWPAWARAQGALLADSDFWLSGLSMAGAFLASAPRLLARWQMAVVGALSEVRSDRPPQDGDPGAGNLVYYLTGPLARDLAWPGLLLALVGMAGMIGRGDRTSRVVLVAPTAYLLFMSLGALRWDHYVLPVVPFAVLAVARGVTAVAQSIGERPARPVLALVLGVAIVTQPLRRSVDLSLTYGRPLTSQAATEWFIAHAPPGRGLRVLTETSDVMLQPGGYDVTLVAGVGQIDPRLITRARFDWVILSSSVDDAFAARVDRYPDEARLSHLIATWPVAARFEPRPPDVEGPTIRFFVPPAGHL